MSSPVLTRTLSALVLAPPLLFLVVAGSPLLLFLLSVPVAILLIYEWHRLREPFSLPRFLPLLFGVLLILLTQIPENGVSASAEVQTTGFMQPWPSVTWVPSSALFSFLLLLFFTEGLLQYRPDKPVLEDVSKRFLGVVYCTVPLVLLVEIRSIEKGGLLICFLLLTIWATDVGAYFMGRRWGNRKLAPYISPGKTYAGFWGGILLASITGGGLAYSFSLPFGWLQAVFLAGVLSVIGQVGDLAESLLKREAGVKDSSQLIPGHGGLLDRLDSLLFAAPAFYLFLWIYLSLTLKDTAP